MGPYSLQSAVSNISYSKDISSASFSLTPGTVTKITSDTSVSMASNMDFYSRNHWPIAITKPARLSSSSTLHPGATVTTPSSFNLHYKLLLSSPPPSLW